MTDREIYGFAEPAEITGQPAIINGKLLFVVILVIIAGGLLIKQLHEDRLIRRQEDLNG